MEEGSKQLVGCVCCCEQCEHECLAAVHTRTHITALYTACQCVQEGHEQSATTAWRPTSLLDWQSSHLPARQTCGVQVAWVPSGIRLSYLFSPRSLDKFWIQHLLPSVQTLHICPVIKVLSCRCCTTLSSSVAGDVEISRQGDMGCQLVNDWKNKSGKL